MPRPSAVALVRTRRTCGDEHSRFPPLPLLAWRRGGRAAADRGRGEPAQRRMRRSRPHRRDPLETERYQAHATFQAQIPQAVECDLVLTIFKWRLGTALPPNFPERLPTGEPFPSGTAYEL